MTKWEDGIRSMRFLHPFNKCSAGMEPHDVISEELYEKFVRLYGYFNLYEGSSRGRFKTILLGKQQKIVVDIPNETTNLIYNIFSVFMCPFCFEDWLQEKVYKDNNFNKFVLNKVGLKK